MVKLNFRIHNRIKDFWLNTQWDKFLNFNFMFILSGWFLTFFLIIFSVESNLLYLISIAYIVFWVKLNRNFLKIVSPPIELLILLLLIISGIAFSNFNLLQKFAVTVPLNILFLSIIVLLTGFILILNNENKQGVLVTLVFWGFINYFFSFYDNFMLAIGFQFILFLILIGRTSWLEKLTATELWIALVIFLNLYINLFNFDFYNHFHIDSCYQNLLISELYYFLFLLFRIYLLAFIIKIPLVLVYNHAGLARKLKIAGIFQSTLPQFFQLVLLLLIFYFSISSWQAQNTKTAIFEELKNIKEDYTSYNISYKKIENFNSSQPIKIKSYKPFILEKNYPHMGVVAIAAEYPDNISDLYYFIYFTDDDSLTNSVHFIKIDSFFLKTFTPKIPTISGSGILAYPYYANRRESYFYDFDFWREDESLKIFPFALISQQPAWKIKSLFKPLNQDFLDVDLNIKSNLSRLCAGRTYLPILKSRESDSYNYFAFDIFYALNLDFFNSQLGKILIGLILTYFLINAFIIKSVTKFGDEITRLIIRKFQQLKEGIKEISQGHLDYKVHVEGEDEFAELAGHFNSMSIKLNKSIDNLKEKERLDQELKIARNVQLSLLPEKLPEADNYQFVSKLETAAEVGGDLYDVIKLEDNKYLFTIGDVSGKGTSAAFYMAQFLSLLRFSAQFTQKPDEIAYRINEYFAKEVKTKQIFVTAIIGLLDTEKNKMKFIRAGHCLPGLIRKEEPKKYEEITSSGLGIGLVSSSKQFKTLTEVKEITFNPGDKIIFYTDGIVEASRKNKVHKEHEELYEEDRFKDIVLSSSDSDAEITAQNIIEDLKKFYGKTSPSDDYTILIIQRN